MEVYISNNKLLIITEPKTTCFDLPIKVENSLKHEIDFIIKKNKVLAHHTIRNETSRLLSKYKHRSDIHKHRKQ